MTAPSACCSTRTSRRAARGAPALRHRIEHCSLVDDDIVRRIAALGLVPVPFGSYARFHGDKLPGYYGEQRLERLFAHRTLLDAGIRVAGSSDYPCGPFEPLAAITSCTTRRALDGTPIGLSQRITVEEAVASTRPGRRTPRARSGRRQARPGSSPTSSSLSADPYITPPEEVVDLQVRSTWVGAECVYDASTAG